jgi:hypothetical protein
MLTLLISTTATNCSFLALKNIKKIGQTISQYMVAKPLFISRIKKMCFYFASLWHDESHCGMMRHNYSIVERYVTSWYDASYKSHRSKMPFVQIFLKSIFFNLITQKLIHISLISLIISQTKFSGRTCVVHNVWDNCVFD